MLATGATTLSVVPLLWVKDMEQSLQFYQQIGFTLTESWKPSGNIQWCRVEFHNAALMLQEIDETETPQVQIREGNDIQLYFITDNIDSLYQ